MLREIAFANSIALVTIFFFLVFYVGSIVAPNSFRFLRNAQFLGADIDQITPKKFSLPALAGILLTLFVTSWVFGYLGLGCIISWQDKMFEQLSGGSGKLLGFRISHGVTAEDVMVRRVHL